MKFPALALDRRLYSFADAVAKYFVVYKIKERKKEREKERERKKRNAE